MNSRSFLWSLLFVLSACNNKIQSLPHTESYSYSTSTDITSLIMLKSELESAKKVLLDYQQSQTLSLVKNATDSLSWIIKEIMYGTGAIALGLGAVGVTAGIVYGPREIADTFNKMILKVDMPPHGSAEKNELIGRLMLVFPASIVAIILSYVVLKLSLSRSPIVDKELTSMAKKALIDIEKVLNKVDHKINLATGVPLAK